MFSITESGHVRAGGLVNARRLIVAALAAIASVPLAAFGASIVEPDVSVHEDAGLYRVAAAFKVAQPVSIVMAVLTDYEQIPRFTPDVRVSNVLERGEGRALIEQEAIARFMMFSKRIHLVLDVQEGADVLHFHDRCGQSFAQYDGWWAIAEIGKDVEITYELRAKPRFEVPEFLLKRLLKRDAIQMIQGLRTEMFARARALAR